MLLCALSSVSDKTSNNTDFQHRNVRAFTFSLVSRKTSRIHCFNSWNHHSQRQVPHTPSHHAWPPPTSVDCLTSHLLVTKMRTLHLGDPEMAQTTHTIGSSLPLISTPTCGWSPASPACQRCTVKKCQQSCKLHLWWLPFIHGLCKQGNLHVALSNFSLFVAQTASTR